jgi:hypothetical protein
MFCAVVHLRGGLILLKHKETGGEEMYSVTAIWKEFTYCLQLQNVWLSTQSLSYKLNIEIPDEFFFLKETRPWISRPSSIAIIYDTETILEVVLILIWTCSVIKSTNTKINRQYCVFSYALFLCLVCIEITQVVGIISVWASVCLSTSYSSSTYHEFEWKFIPHMAGKKLSWEQH